MLGVIFVVFIIISTKLDRFFRTVVFLLFMSSCILYVLGLFL